MNSRVMTDRRALTSRRSLLRGIHAWIAAIILLAAAATSEAGKVSLTWNASTDPDVAGYVIWYGTVPGIYTDQVDVGNTTGWTVTGLLGGPVYYFAVQAYNSSGLFGALSTQVSASTTNQPPSVTNPGTQNTDEGTVVSLQIGATDPDGDPLTYSATNLPPGLSIDPVTGLISGTLPITGAATRSVTVTVNSVEYFASATFTWNVLHVNHPPVLTNPGNRSNPVGASVVLQLIATDADNIDSLSYVVDGLPPGLSVNSTSGSITGTLTTAGTYPVSAHVFDGSVTVSQNFTWTVPATNAAPTLTNPGNKSSNINTAVTLQLVASDPDGNTLTYSASALPTGLSIGGQTGLISGTPTAGGTFHVSASVSDGSLSSTVNFNWTILAPNLAPVLQDPGDLTLVEGHPVSIQLIASDPEGDHLTFFGELPDGLTISVGGLISGSPTVGTADEYSVLLVVSDGQHLTSAFPIWTVVPNYTPILANPGDQSSAGGATVSKQLLATDANNDPITYSATGLPPGISVNANTGLISGTLGSSSGSYNVTATASDGIASADQSFTWTVTGGAATQNNDFDGDGKADIAVYRPSTGTWYAKRSTSNNTSYTATPWGLSTDTAVPADYDGDGKADIAVYRPSSGVWYIKQSSTNNTTYTSLTWGSAGDVPVPGDYDGDGKADIAVYRPSAGVWYIKQSSTNNTTYTSLAWGSAGDVPVPGDYDGDGKTDIAVYRPSTGVWYVKQSSTNNATYTAISWGLPGDTPVQGDYDGDHKIDVAVYRPTTGAWYFKQSSTNNTSYGTVAWGAVGDVPVPGDYDGDGKNDPVVYRPSTGMWYVRQSSTSYATYSALPWGVDTDLPLLKAQ